MRIGLAAAVLGLLAVGARPGCAQMTAKNVAAQQKACDAGTAPACFVMGLVYTDGLGGTAKDLMKAKDYFQKACDAKVGNACVSLATMYQQGLGVEKDAAKAAEMKAKACELGNKDSCS